MPSYASQLSSAIRSHLDSLIRGSGLPETEESREEMARVWFEKKAMFEGQINALDMRGLERFPADDPRGALLLTWSGSLLSIGPRQAGGGRPMEYSSIELRTDVPHLARAADGHLRSDLARDEHAQLRDGPIASTSPVLAIVSCDASVPPEEQEKRIREATIFLTSGFVRINRTVTRHGQEDYPEQMTMKSIVTYLARKNDLSQKATRQLLEDYLVMLESGLLLGLRVPLGKMGRLMLTRRAARKARLGINPATGEKITLSARPPELAPRMTFSRLVRDRARRTPFPE
jgi:nucleoid DNA-binding protein